MNGVSTRNNLWCPICEEMVPHDRGYLREHYTQRQRGVLVTGKTMCDGSNMKPPQDVKTARFTGTCPACLGINVVEFTETYPGSLDKSGGVIVQNCADCGPKGHYCSNCDHLLHEKDVPVAQAPPDIRDEHETTLWMIMQSAQVSTLDLVKAARDQFSLPVTDDRVEELFKANAIDAANGGTATTVKVYVDKGGDRECPDSEDHDPVYRPETDRPVVLTDNHIIRLPDQDEPDDMRDLGFRCSPDGPQYEGED